MSLAPVLLFTYKRLDTLKKTVSHLLNNNLAAQTDLFIFSDAAKTEEDSLVVERVRQYIGTVKGFKSVNISCAKVNKGLANSIIEGVSSILKNFDSVIVLEDDLRTSPNFLDFMNQALERYKNCNKVFSISGYSFSLPKENNNFDTYFLNRGWSWGWATWKDRWDIVDWEVRTYDRFKGNIKERKEFAKGGSDLNRMLDNQMKGKLDSWAIRWFFHQFQVNGLTVYPVLSKVYNEGFDEDATHTKGSSRRYIPNLDRENNIHFKFEDEIKENIHYQKRFRKIMGIRQRVVSKLETFLLRLFN